MWNPVAVPLSAPSARNQLPFGAPAADRSIGGGGGGGGGGGPPPSASVLMRCPLASAKAVDVTIIHSLRAVLAAMRG